MEKVQFKPSKNQKAIFKFVTDEEGNAVVNAVAGSGKTTTLIEAVKLIGSDKRILFLAFNKSIKQEIQVRINALNLLNVEVDTCHGFGYKAIINASNSQIELNNRKYPQLYKAIVSFIETGDEEAIIKYKFTADDLVCLKDFTIDDEIKEKYEFQKRVIQLAAFGRLFLTTSADEMKQISKNYSMSLEDNEHILAEILIKLGDKVESEIDFTDMIYLPNDKDLDCPKYDFVFIDECQDLNSAQRNLMLKSLDVDSRFLAVGDRNQAIYGFAGADAESFQKLINLPDTKTLPLSLSYRCGSSIIDTIIDIVPEIKPFKKNGKGKVIHDGSVDDMKDGDMVLCRNTYPLVKLCLKLLKGGVKATINGGDVGKTLITLIKDTKKKTMNEVFDVLYHKMELTCKRIMKANDMTTDEAKQDAEYQMGRERISIIEAIYKSKDSVDQVIARLDVIFGDNGTSGILLSTIHKAKGLEAENVFIIHPELIPSEMAVLPWELVQEDNLKYVAHTRAIKKLVMVADYDAFSKNKGESFANKVKPIKDSNYVGRIGGRVHMVGKIIEIKQVPQYKTIVVVIEDDEGNLYQKWGPVNGLYITSRGNKLEVGCKVDASVQITKHSEFMGVKMNSIKGLKVHLDWN
jgi:superfamily I DNA/RNA helicase